MPTRYEFGFGDGEIYRRRMRGQAAMHDQARREREAAEDSARSGKPETAVESGFYGFRGAGSRSRPRGTGGRTGSARKYYRPGR